MNDQAKDWKHVLQIWLQQNAKVLPDDLRQLREAFVQRFPLEHLGNMTLDEYAVGKPDSFCYWLEFKTRELGSIRGGSAAKFGVWWSKDENRWRWNSIYHSAEDALARITGGLVTLTQAVREGQMNALDKIGAERYSLRGKLLSLYFPDQFLPISHPGHLTPYGQSKLVDIWDDTKIKPGDKWRDEIKKAIEAAKVAVLLISADYLASRFITEDELPPLLASAEQEGTTIFPIILSPCAFEYTKLSQFQAVNSPSSPISKMGKYQREALYASQADIRQMKYSFEKVKERDGGQ